MAMPSLEPVQDATTVHLAAGDTVDEPISLDSEPNDSDGSYPFPTSSKIHMADQDALLTVGHPFFPTHFMDGANDAPAGSVEDSTIGEFLNFGDDVVFVPNDNESTATQLEAIGESNLYQNGSAEPSFTVDTCVQRVLEIFPDICHEHVATLYNDFDHHGDFEILPGPARLENIIDKLISSNSYPKQAKESRSLKRKRGESPSRTQADRWLDQNRQRLPRFLKGPIQALLKADFPEIPTAYINNTFAMQGFLFPAYTTLAKAKDDDHGTQRLFGRGRASRNNIDADTIAVNIGWPELIEELAAARAHVVHVREESRAAELKKIAEHENLERAKAEGTLAECSACFDDLPTNRQIYCDGMPAHFTCLECALTYIKTEVGESRCSLQCPSGCGAVFSTQQLNLIGDESLLEKLSQLQQEKDIRDAGLEDLEECPFCDYKVILPPIEEDFEFRCANPECEKVSCRRCKCVSHVPISCEEYAKENKLNSRHKIEEAMTAALVRSCNNCKNHFIKEYGCNKMSCSSCGNLQCYVCSATIKDYNHFDRAEPGAWNNAATGGKPARARQCPLYDNVEERHEREVREAERKAREQVVAENPGVTAEDLEIKVSDAVKNAARMPARPRHPLVWMEALNANQLPGRAIQVPDEFQALYDRALDANYDGAADDDNFDWMDDLPFRDRAIQYQRHAERIRRRPRFPRPRQLQRDPPRLGIPPLMAEVPGLPPPQRLPVRYPSPPPPPPPLPQPPPPEPWHMETLMQPLHNFHIPPHPPLAPNDFANGIVNPLARVWPQEPRLGWCPRHGVQLQPGLPANSPGTLERPALREGQFYRDHLPAQDWQLDLGIDVDVEEGEPNYSGPSNVDFQDLEHIPESHTPPHSADPQQNESHSPEAVAEPRQASLKFNAGRRYQHHVGLSQELGQELQDEFDILPYNRDRGLASTQQQMHLLQRQNENRRLNEQLRQQRYLQQQQNLLSQQQQVWRHQYVLQGQERQRRLLQRQAWHTNPQPNMLQHEIQRGQAPQGIIPGALPLPFHPRDCLGMPMNFSPHWDQGTQPVREPADEDDMAARAMPIDGHHPIETINLGDP